MKSSPLVALVLALMWHAPAWAEEKATQPLPAQGVFAAAIQQLDTSSRRPDPFERAERALVPQPRQSATQPAGARDSVSNGIAIGTAIGAAGGFALISVMYAQCDGSCEAPAFWSLAAPVTAFGAAVGALAGYLVDRFR